MSTATAKFNVNMEYLHKRPSVDPYMYISADVMKVLDDGRRYRLVIYGAYKAMGLIGTEMNGIAIFDQQRMSVLCDEIDRCASGYETPSRVQMKTLNAIMELTDEQFIRFVNLQHRVRYKL